MKTDANISVRMRVRYCDGDKCAALSLLKYHENVTFSCLYERHGKRGFKKNNQKQEGGVSSVEFPEL